MGLLYQCEICNRTISPHYVEYDWDYNVNDDGDMDMGKYLTIDANGKTVKYVYANFHKDIDIVKIIDRSLRSLQGIKIIEIDGIEK